MRSPCLALFQLPRIAWLGLVVAGWAGAALSQEASPSPDRVLATVDGQPIWTHEVEREVKRVLGNRKAEPGALAALRTKALQQLIDRRLVLRYLADHGFGASDQDIDVAIQRVRKQLAQQEVLLEDYLQRAGLTEDEFRQVLAWQIGWRRYLERFITDENLERYFDKHRRDFDGTTMRVAHILFRVEPGGDARALSQALERTERVRRQILSGQLTFADAAKRYSQAPSADRGGDLGSIGRHGPMPEPFSRAAFALEKGELSQPVVTSAGVHLIQCRDIQPGTRTWQQARHELVPAVTQYLFQWVADQQRPHATIQRK